MKLKVTRKTHCRREGGVLKVYGPGQDDGDTFEGSANELRIFGDRLVKAGNDESPSEAQPTEVDPDVQAVLNSNADDAEEMLGALNNDQLDQLADRETRKGMQKAIKAEQESRAA